MTIQATPIQDLVVLQPNVFSDDRGWFVESYNQAVFAELGITEQFVQDNHSSSKAGVLRGLHFQRPPFAQGKLVRCTAGRLWDVAVDLRQDSPTYMKWHGLELSAENKTMLYIPPGFAHGFLALTDCEMQYKCTNVYNKESDGGLIWNDPTIHIDWPLDHITGEPILSEKDTALPELSGTELPF